MSLEVGDEVRFSRVASYVPRFIRAWKRGMGVAMILARISNFAKRALRAICSVLYRPFGHAAVSHFMLFHVSFPSIAGSDHPRIDTYEAPMAMASSGRLCCLINRRFPGDVQERFSAPRACRRYGTVIAVIGRLKCTERIRRRPRCIRGAFPRVV